jgi:methionyl-tRNA formyltransferase
MNATAKTAARTNAEPLGFILCMPLVEAEFFDVLLRGSDPAWILRVTSLAELRYHVDRLGGPARLISFCSDIIVPQAVIQQLNGECFNFHPGPPERPGDRPAAFAAAQGATTFGVTFHSMIEEVDAGPIHALRRFSIEGLRDEEQIGIATYGHLMWLAVEVIGRLSDPNHRFEESGCNWGTVKTRRRDYDTLVSHRAGGPKSALPLADNRAGKSPAETAERRPIPIDRKRGLTRPRL